MSDFTAINPTLSINSQLLNDIFVTAIEGGINYWAQVNQYNHNIDNYSADITITESPNDFTQLDYTINQQTIINGINKIANHQSRLCKEIMSNVMTENFDAEDADIIAQVGLFGTPVFG